MEKVSDGASEVLMRRGTWLYANGLRGSHSEWSEGTALNTIHEKNAGISYGTLILFFVGNKYSRCVSRMESFECGLNVCSVFVRCTHPKIRIYVRIQEDIYII